MSPILGQRLLAPVRQLQGAAGTAVANCSSQAAFVSKHFRSPPKEFGEVLGKLQSQSAIRTGGDGFLEVRECHMCEKPNKSKADNLWKLRCDFSPRDAGLTVIRVHRDGSFHCFRCGEHGSWFELKRRLMAPTFPLGMTQQEVVNPTSYFPRTEDEEGLVSESKRTAIVLPDQNAAFAYHLNMFPYGGGNQIPILSEVKKAQLDAYSFIEKRGLSLEVCRKFGVGLTVQEFPDDSPVKTGGAGQRKLPWRKELCLTFPWMCDLTDLLPREREAYENLDPSAKRPVQEDVKSIILRTKVRALSNKGKQRVLPKGGGYGFFGWHLVSTEHSEIVITEGEFDAMAVHQALSALPSEDPLQKLPVVSLPNGCNNLPPDLVLRLERFSKIYLWLDNDAPGQAACVKFSKKLGLNRCLAVRPLPGAVPIPKDANEALQNGVDLAEMLRRATSIPDERILTFSHLRDEVLIFTDPSAPIDGTSVSSLPRFNRIVKGFRRGELVVLTGPTGSGKTTFLSQLSLDFAKLGKSVLWGSFEIKNVQLLRKMFMQFTKMSDLSVLKREKIELLGDDFEQLPLYFLNFFGGTDVDEVIEAMDFAVYKYDVEHIFIDNLQFMMPRSYLRKGSNFDKFEAQDAVIDRFRKFATDKQVNVILVIHPRKEEETTRLSLASVFGTGKATQEADMVMILQRVNGMSSIDVKKNRYDGDLGSVPLEFSGATQSYFEVKSDIIAPVQRKVTKKRATKRTTQESGTEA